MRCSACTRSPCPSKKPPILTPLCARGLRRSVSACRCAILPQLAVSRRSVDARGNGEVRFTLTLDVRLRAPDAEAAFAKRFPPNLLTRLTDEEKAARDIFCLRAAPYDRNRPRPVVVGAGPAGLFCALALAVRGAKPVLLERGKPVAERAADVAAMEADGLLDPESNVLFGEGGAGAFSDGKLTCGLSDPLIRTVLQTLVTCGAPEDILIAAKPHIGTDLLRGVLADMRRRLVALGGEPRFGHLLTGLRLSDGRVTGAWVRSGGGAPVCLETDAVYLAIGHSARDTYEWLARLGVPMQRKPFAMGVRVEHPQALIDRAQYGAMAGARGLPPAEYKLNVPTPDGRGRVHVLHVPRRAGDQRQQRNPGPCSNVNGMSPARARGGQRQRGAAGGRAPRGFLAARGRLPGLRFSGAVERRAFRRGGRFMPPHAQRCGRFFWREGRARDSAGVPAKLPARWSCRAMWRACLPPFIAEGFARRAAKARLQAARVRSPRTPLLTAPENALVLAGAPSFGERAAGEAKSGGL